MRDLGRARRLVATALVVAAAACDTQLRFDVRGDAGEDDDAAAGPTCDPPCGLSLVCAPRNHCYECVADADCTRRAGGAARRCIEHQCYQPCGSDTDCPPQAVHCEDGLCEACEEEWSCECRYDADCAGQRCDPRSRACVDCVFSSDCPPERPWCDPDVLTCVTDG